MTRYDYMQLKLADMPDNLMAHYHLCDIATPNGYLYCKICQGMYGLPQAGIIAQELLENRLKEHGYTQMETTPGLWTHEWCPIIFSLVVDNFGVKYIGEEHAQHLLQMMQKYYTCLFKKKGERYCGLTIKWDYVGKKVHLSMPSYIKTFPYKITQVYSKVSNAMQEGRLTFVFLFCHVGRATAARQYNVEIGQSYPYVKQSGLTSPGLI